MRMKQTKNKRSGRKRLVPTLACFRSAVTNGSRLIESVDGRSATMRRFRDILFTHEADLGGADILTEGQRALARRATLLQLQLEMMEQKFAQREDGCASAKEIECYQRASSAFRRLLESLGLHEARKPRDVTPDQVSRLIDGVVKQARASA